MVLALRTQPGSYAVTAKKAGPTPHAIARRFKRRCMQL
jgi:hypothetical protein